MISVSLVVRTDHSPDREGFSPNSVACAVVPTLSVEIIQPTDTCCDILDKVRDYFFNGVQQVWVIYPRQRYVYLYTADDQVRILTEKGELDGGDLIPGFRLPLSTLFGVAIPPAQG